MHDEIYLKLISATIMQRAANKPIGAQMYTITGSSNHYVAVACILCNSSKTIALF